MSISRSAPEPHLREVREGGLLVHADDTRHRDGVAGHTDDDGHVVARLQHLTGSGILA